MQKNLIQKTQRSNVLILTATITPPPGVPLLKRTDPQQRLKDYEEALLFYISLLQHCIDFIVFVENSNSDISSLRRIVEQFNVSEKVEFLVFDGLDYPTNYGRAYGEFKLLDYAMQHSLVIQSLDETAIIWKITGRYIVKNFRQIVDLQPAHFDIYCNFRLIPKRWADMFLLAWTLQGYRSCLNGIYHKLIADKNRLIQPEETFINLLKNSSQKIKLVKRLNRTPLIIGLRGSDSQNYSESHNLWKFRVRQLACIVVPWLWV